MASAASSLHGGGGNERFNAEAANWDANPFVHAASRDACTALLASFPRLADSPPSLTVLDLGCGTGLLSIPLAPHARRLIAIDAAEGMIHVLKEKLARSNAPDNVIPLAVLLEDPEDPVLPEAVEGGKGRVKVDLIVSHLVLHHIPELKGVLKTMFGCLRAGGEVGLTDFMEFGEGATGSRRFHAQSKMAGVERHGINPVAFKSLMEEVGFVDVDVSPKWTIKKTVERHEGEFGNKGRADPGEGEVMEFPFLLCYGRRP